jgi:hypothetical protein
MKKIIFLITLFCSMSFGQGWNTTVTTSLSEPNLEKMDLFANSSGIHLLIKRTSGYILYYKLNSEGQVVIPVEENPVIFSTNGDFPAITGTADIVYAFYKEGSNVKGRYSTTGGDSWISLPDRSTTSNTANGVDAVYQSGSGGGVHLVWATQDAGSNFKTYYSRLEDNQWVEFQDVTDHSSAPVGSIPSVTFSPNRVHVSFNMGATTSPDAHGGDVRTRDRVNGVWQTPVPAVSYPEESGYEKLIVRGSTMYLFYSKREIHEHIVNDLLYRTRSVSGGSWSDPSTLAETISINRYSFDVSRTFNNNIHLVFMHISGLLYRFFNGSTWSSPVTLDETANTEKSVSFSSVSNDLFVAWPNITNSYLRYKQNDQNPLAPANLTIGNENNHPKLQWTKNNEPDVTKYYIYRNPGSGFQYLGQTTGTYYVDETLEYCTVPPPAQCQDVNTYTYYVTALDIGSNESPPSNSVKAELVGGPPQKAGVTNPAEMTEFSLGQNYPNPFNPTTEISYSIQQDAVVTLRVYDVLGNEVALLVNEVKTAGYYEETFDASNLSSGIYIYRITALRGERILFNESKRMILLK